MKIFAPASSSSDSSYLLYKLLTETRDQIITRIFHLDASVEDLTQHRLVSEWLKTNVRNFDYGFAEFEYEHKQNDIIYNKWYNIGKHAERYKCDSIYIGYNTYNWSPSNWFFQTKDNIDAFFDSNGPYNRTDHSGLRSVTDLPVHWPFMNRTSTPIGRWQIYEHLPTELRSLISTGCGECGRCPKCYCKKWYFQKKNEGFTAEQIDDLIMREGEYGKYWKPESTPSERHKAYMK